MNLHLTVYQMALALQMLAVYRVQGEVMFCSCCEVGAWRPAFKADVRSLTVVSGCVLRASAISNSHYRATQRAWVAEI